MSSDYDRDRRIMVQAARGDALTTMIRRSPYRVPGHAALYHRDTFNGIYHILIIRESKDGTGENHSGRVFRRPWGVTRYDTCVSRRVIRALLEFSAFFGLHDTCDTYDTYILSFGTAAVLTPVSEMQRQCRWGIIPCRRCMRRPKEDRKGYKA